MVNEKEIIHLKNIFAKDAFLDRNSVEHHAAMQYITNYLNELTDNEPYKTRFADHGLRKLRSSLIHSVYPFTSVDPKTGKQENEKEELEALRECINFYLPDKDGNINPIKKANATDYYKKYCHIITLPPDKRGDDIGAGAIGAAETLHFMIGHQIGFKDKEKITKQFVAQSFQDLKAAQTILKGFDKKSAHIAAAKARLIINIHEIGARLGAQNLSCDELNDLLTTTIEARRSYAHGRSPPERINVDDIIKNITDCNFTEMEKVVLPPQKQKDSQGAAAATVSADTKVGAVQSKILAAAGAGSAKASAESTFTRDDVFGKSAAPRKSDPLNEGKKTITFKLKSQQQQSQSAAASSFGQDKSTPASGAATSQGSAASAAAGREQVSLPAKSEIHTPPIGLTSAIDPAQEPASLPKAPVHPGDKRAASPGGLPQTKIPGTEDRRVNEQAEHLAANLDEQSKERGQNNSPPPKNGKAQSIQHHTHT